jgi:hypothetical protein
LHVARERYRAALADLMLDLFADGHSGRGARRGMPALLRLKDQRLPTIRLAYAATRIGSPAAWKARLIGGMAR